MILLGLVIGFLGGLYLGIRIGATKMVEEVLAKIMADPTFEKNVVDAIHKTLREVANERLG